MQQRSPIIVVLLSLVTCGFYALYWYVQTKGEMVQRGASIPSAILLIIPLANIWWIWEYSKGVEHVTLLFLFCGIIGIPMTQSAFNRVAA